jgi:hypothetical protein
VEWIYMAQNRAKKRALVNGVKKDRVEYIAGIF